MSPRYLVVKAELQREAEVAIQTDEIEIAITNFKESAKKVLDCCIILYDSQEDKVCRAFVQCEPIHLVMAIEVARMNTGNALFPVKDQQTCIAKSGETKLINLIVTKLSNSKTTSKNRNFDDEYIIEPYHAFELQSGGVSGSVGSAVAVALSGGVVGFVTGGPPGAICGSLLGGLSIGTSTTYFSRMNSPQKCKDCMGSGLKGNNYRCRNCHGFGYPKESF